MAAEKPVAMRSYVLNLFAAAARSAGRKALILAAAKDKHNKRDKVSAVANFVYNAFKAVATAAV